MSDDFCVVFQGLSGNDGLQGRKGDKGELGIVGMRGIKVFIVFLCMFAHKTVFILCGFNLERGQ